MFGIGEIGTWLSLTTPKSCLGGSGNVGLILALSMMEIDYYCAYGFNCVLS
jgi:hypothetical protein